MEKVNCKQHQGWYYVKSATVSVTVVSIMTVAFIGCQLLLNILPAPKSAMGFHVSHSHEPKLKTNPHFSNLETKNVLLTASLSRLNLKTNKKQKTKTTKQNQKTTHFLFIELQA